MRDKDGKDGKDGARRAVLREDLREVLSTEAGRRIVGSIFHLCRRDAATLALGSFALTAYQEGMRAVANAIAGDIREIDPRLAAECEIAYAKFARQFGEGQEEDEDDERDG